MPERHVAGRYRLEQLLGSSRMSEVWAAQDLELGRPVAVKLLAPEADTSRFEREARAVAALAHQNIIGVFDYGETGGRPFLVFEYVGGGTLEERLRDRRRLPDEETLAIAREIAAGLAHAHSHGVVHRDLKPANVLFDDEGRAKLGDFGVARLADESTLTEAGSLVGTAAYLSPEQAAGAPARTPSDVYSFGVVLYRMLTGRLPFESDDLFELVRLHRDAEPPPVSEMRPDVPAALATVVAAALAKQQSERPPDGTALLDLLGGADGMGAVVGPAAAEATTRVVAQPPVVRSAARSRRAPLLTAGAVALALVGAGLAWDVGQPADGSSPPATVRAKRPTTAHHLPSTSTTASPATTLPTTTARTSPTDTRATTTTHAATRPPATTAPRTASTGATTTAPASPPTTGTTLPTTTTTATTTTATTTPTTDTTTPTTPTTTAATTTDPTATSTAETTTTTTPTPATTSP